MELTQFEKTGPNEAKLTVKVTAEEFGRAVDAAIREKGKKLTVPGFRKGKAPKALLEKAYGREYFYQDAVNETYGYAYDAAVKQADIVPVDRADIELVECSEDGYTFTATVTRRIILREGYIYIKFVADIVTANLLFKAGNERTGAESEVIMLALAALERNVVLEAFVVDFGNISVLSGSAFNVNISCVSLKHTVEL